MLSSFILIVLVPIVSPKSFKADDNEVGMMDLPLLTNDPKCNLNLGQYIIRIVDSTPANTLIGLLNCSDVQGNVTFQVNSSQNVQGIFDVIGTTGQIYLRQQNPTDLEYKFTVLVYSDSVLTVNISVQVYINFYPPECTNTEMEIEMTDDQVTCNTSNSLVTCQNPQGGIFNYTSSSSMFDVSDAEGGSFNICPAVSLEDKVGVYEVIVIAKNDIGEVSIIVTVTVLDVNSAPMFINLRNFTITERSTIGTNLGLINATDNDVEPTYKNLTYSIADIAPESNHSVFILDSSHNLRLGTTVNASVTSVYVLTLNVTDAGGLSDVADIFVVVEDENDAPLCTRSSLSLNVDTRIPVGQAVEKVNCWDWDSKPKFRTIEYSTVGQDDELFAIDQSGSIKVAKSLPDQNKIHNFEIKVTDQQSVETNATHNATVIPVRINILKACTQGCVNGECINGQCVCDTLHSGEDCNSLATGAAVGFSIVAVGLFVAVVLLVGYVAFGFNPFSCIMGLVRS